MTAAEALAPYVDMQIVGAHHTVGGVMLELAVVGRLSRRFVTLTGVGFDVVVTEMADPPAPRYRNRRGYTADLAQHHIDQGDDMYEREREGRE